MQVLIKLRKEAKRTQQQMANYLGITQQGYAAYENNTRVPPMDMAIKLADYFGVSVDYLLGRDETPELDVFKFPTVRPVVKRKVPLLGNIACGKPIFIEEEHEFITMEDLDLNFDFCLIAKGDSMIDARINDGDLIFIRKQSVVSNGEIAAVRIGDEATLKRVYFYPEKQKLVLNPANPAYEPLMYIGEELVDIEIMGKAVAFQSVIK